MPVLSGASDASYLQPACAVQSGIARGSRRAQDAPDPWKWPIRVPARCPRRYSGQRLVNDGPRAAWIAASRRGAPAGHGGEGATRGSSRGSLQWSRRTRTRRRRPAPMRRKPQNEASPRRDSQAHLGAVTARATVHTFKSNNHGAQPRRQHGARPRHPADHDDPF